MMKAIDRIKYFIISANELFPVLKFRCGFGSTEHTYIVEVKPLEEFNNNEDYAKMERDFCVSFQKEYNEDDVIFVSEDDLIAVKDVIFAIGEPQYCESNITFDLDIFLKETYSFENTVPKDEYISTLFVYGLAA